MKQLLYLGWLGRKNLGDDLMWDLFETMADQYLEKSKYNITPSFKGVDIKNIRHYDHIVLGGGSIINKKNINILYVALKNRKEVSIWGSGIDLISKNDMERLDSKEKINFLDQQSESKLIEIIDKANFVGVRGPLTYKVLKNIGVNMETVRIFGDPGLLLDKPKLTKKSSIKGFGENEKIIGLNWGTSYNKIFGKDELKVENQLVDSLKYLINKGYKIFIYNVWDKDIEASINLYDKIGDEENVRLSTELYHQDELMNIIEHFTFTINFKLHPNVISIAAGVPFIALGYRFKVYDLCKSIGLDHLVIATDMENIQKRISDLEEYISGNRIEIIETSSSEIQKYQNRLAAPFIKQMF
ncbi:polysaccharide pyruvyl transferase family protein [Cytobacillus oceanisediminis]|uniref:polysaccharide pyruvyl transferase family protein n=1 Tax=Cytobacillus oceanisediminis TaxID=665099 RepID=UPI0023DAD6D5|nr:polysaccharide pyruvyl transferase family protein [Cytobacillus oceanisediminis]MDF2035790.1 polysaccharide pyruvyl transferase family protein [Cytobacillus oceanisediminis]